jgi:hypothetical protein
MDDSIAALRRSLRIGGYSPIPYIGKEPVIPGWNTKLTTNDAEIDLWGKLYPNALSTGALCKYMPTIDIDIKIAEAAAAVESLVRARNEELGLIMVRFGNSPKRAIPLRTDRPFGKMKTVLIAPDGSPGQKIEILCDGQQVIFDGIHPDTNRPYGWFGRTPFETPLASLPPILEHDAKELHTDAIDLLIKEYGYEPVPESEPQANGRGRTSLAYLFAEIRAGRNLHDNTTILAAKLAVSDMKESMAIDAIRDALEGSQRPHDDEWQRRLDDVPRLYESAVRKYRPPKPAPAAPIASSTRAQELKAMAFNPVRFLVINLIPNEGVTLVCAKPKSGKSWLVLDLALACTMDRYTLGQIKPLQGSVLYLALEDSLRRLRSRIDKLLPPSATEWPEHLTLATEWRRVDQDGLDDIRYWVLNERAEGRTVAFVAVDVLKLVRPATVKGKPAYEADYDALTGLQKLARDLAIAILVVHHTRKADSDDLLDKVSGTFGLSGAADTILVMEKRAGGWIFDIRGRDVSADELAAEFSKDACRWTILGSAAEVHQTSERNTVLAIFREEGGGPLTTEFVTERLADVSQTQSHSHNAVRQILARMARNGLLKREKRGQYSLLVSSQSRGHEEKDSDFVTPG